MLCSRLTARLLLNPCRALPPVAHAPHIAQAVVPKQRPAQLLWGGRVGCALPVALPTRSWAPGAAVAAVAGTAGTCRSISTSRVLREDAAKQVPPAEHTQDDSKPQASPASPPTTPSGLWAKFKHFVSRENIEAEPGFNRWMSVPGSILVQLSIGSVYAWSIFNTPLTKQLGVVAQAAGDWPLTSVMPIFSACAVSLGLTTFFLGPWAERNGPRAVALAACASWSGGLALTAIGASTHTLPLCYLGYGLLGGAGWGLGYISPVSTLMKWFPDRRGLATGLALSAFGGGAMLATPINESLLNLYFELPLFLGDIDSITLWTEDGVRYAFVDGQPREVVVATAADVARLPADAQPGVYVVGTGNTGVSKTFLSLAALHATSMTIGALTQRVPAPDWLPDGYTPPTPQLNKRQAKSKSMITTANVHYVEALKTPQFWLLWVAVCGNAIAGVSVISCAKTMMGEIFGAALPAIVTSSFAAGYVMALSAGNMGGRFMWANVSDFIGRKNTYLTFGLGVPICFSIPVLTSMVNVSPGVMPLVLFYGGTVAIVSFYGGLFSVLPAYLADVFGQRHVGAIHGRALTAWSTAACCGPLLLSYLRERSYDAAVMELARHANPAQFRAVFGAPLEDLRMLLDTKTVTISNLMTIMPPHIQDPTPQLYDTTLYAMGGLLTVAALANIAMRPVDARHHIQDGSAQPVPVHEPARRRFVVVTPVHKEEAFIQYRPLRRGEEVVLNITRTFVPPSGRGQGLAEVLADEVFEQCAANGVAILPTCSYISDTYLRKNPEHGVKIVDAEEVKEAQEVTEWSGFQEPNEWSGFN